MHIAVIVPFGGTCPHRQRAWAWLRTRYTERHPDWRLIEAPAPQGPWVKGAALASAVEACDAEIIALADADVWSDGLDEAIAAVEAGAPWAIPHEQVLRLSEEGTAALLADGEWQGQPLAQQPYRGIEGGGMVVAPREVIHSIPIDSRFTGWGQEDECHAIAFRALVGEPWRGAADLIHLWHPPQPRMTRRRGSRENWELRRRYFAASQDPRAMRALVEEGRDPRAARQSPLCDHASHGL